MIDTRLDFLDYEQDEEWDISRKTERIIQRNRNSKKRINKWNQ
jgi:hypothetical protein